MGMEKIKKSERIQTLASVLVWLGVWQLAAMAIGQVLFLPSPLQVLGALWGLVWSGLFWGSVWASFVRIGIGFFAGMALGIVLGCAAAANRFAELLLRPMLLIIKATPVASFTILALVWLPSRNLSVLITLLMVMPVVYSGTLGGIRAADKNLLEMAQVYHIGAWRRVRAIYLPALWPALFTACDVALGLAWKSGVAAEVIGQARYSIGGQMYLSKINVLVPELFAWTLTVITVSWVFSRGVMFLLQQLHKLAGRGWVRG